MRKGFPLSRAMIANQQRFKREDGLRGRTAKMTAMKDCYILISNADTIYPFII
jgi:hypothetical protein